MEESKGERLCCSYALLLVSLEDLRTDILTDDRLPLDLAVQAAKQLELLSTLDYLRKKANVVHTGNDRILWHLSRKLTLVLIDIQAKNIMLSSIDLSVFAALYESTKNQRRRQSSMYLARSR